MNGKRVLLLCLDGAPFELFNRMIQAGRMPTMKRLIAGGVNTPLHPALKGAIRPFWASVFTGCYPDRHGLLGDQLPAYDRSGLRAVMESDLAVAPLWKILSQQGRSSNRVALPLTEPSPSLAQLCVREGYPGGFVEGGGWQNLSGNWFGADQKAPTDLEQKIKTLRLEPRAITQAMIADFIPQIADINQDRDRRPAALATVLARSLSLHNTATYLTEHHPAYLECYRYPLLNDLCQIFLPYLDPKPEAVDAGIFEAYKGVLAGACQLFDHMLERLLHICGEDTMLCLVMSHAFDLSPEKRGPGSHASLDFKPTRILEGHCLLHGPGLSPNASIHSLSEADITPTLLAASGVPLPQGMDGRPWVEAFDSTIEWAVSSETNRVSKADKKIQQPEDALSESTRRQLLEQLAKAGYQDPLDQHYQGSLQKLAMIYEINRWQLLVFRGRLKEAVTLAQQICQKRPRDLSLRLALVQELFRLNEIKAAGTLAQESLKLFDSLTTEEKNRLELEISSAMCTALLQSLVEWSAGHKEGAIHCLDTAAKAGPPHPIVDRLRGEAYLRLEADEAALKAFQSVLKTHPEDVEALCGQGRCWMRLQRFDEALDAVLTASELRPASAPIQLLLAQIFEANSQAEMAQAALALCLKLDPHNTEAKAALNRLSD